MATDLYGLGDVKLVYSRDCCEDIPNTDGDAKAVEQTTIYFARTHEVTASGVPSFADIRESRTFQWNKSSNIRWVGQVMSFADTRWTGAVTD